MGASASCSLQRTSKGWESGAVHGCSALHNPLLPSVMRTAVCDRVSTLPHTFLFRIQAWSRCCPRDSRLVLYPVISGLHQQFSLSILPHSVFLRRSHVLVEYAYTRVHLQYLSQYIFQKINTSSQLLPRPPCLQPHHSTLQPK